LLAHTATLAFTALENIPEVCFSGHHQVVEFLQDCLAQAKSDLAFDVRPRALFARWRRMKKFSYLKLPPRFRPTPVPVK
jgi:hypothetical protein